MAVLKVLNDVPHIAWLNALRGALGLPNISEDGVSLLVLQGILFFLGIAALLR